MFQRVHQLLFFVLVFSLSTTGRSQQSSPKDDELQLVSKLYGKWKLLAIETPQKKLDSVPDGMANYISFYPDKTYSDSGWGSNVSKSLWSYDYITRRLYLEADDETEGAPCTLISVAEDKLVFKIDYPRETMIFIFKRVF